MCPNYSLAIEIPSYRYVDVRSVCVFFENVFFSHQTEKVKYLRKLGEEEKKYQK